VSRVQKAVCAVLRCAAAGLCCAAALAQPAPVGTGIDLRRSDTLGDGAAAPIARPEAAVRARAPQVDAGPTSPARVRGLAMRVTGGLRIDDNVLRTDRDTQRDTIMALRPSVLLDGRIGKHDLSLGYSADIARYQRLSKENRFDHSLLAQANLDLDRRLKVDLQSGLELGSDPRGDLGSRVDAPGGPDRWRRHLVAGDVTLGRRIARAQIGLGYEVSGQRYTDNDQQSRDFDRRALRVSGRYNLGPRLSLVSEGTGVWTGYLDPASDLDSREYSALGGVAWEATAKTSGEIKVGVQHRDFYAPGVSSIGGFTWDLRLEWAPRSYSRFSAYSSRSTTDSAFRAGDVESSPATSDLIGVRWRHGLSERLSFEAGAERTLAAFDGGGDDEFISLSASVNFRADRRLNLFAEWGFSSRSSALPDGDYEAGTVFIGITTEFDRMLR